MSWVMPNLVRHRLDAKYYAPEFLAIEQAVRAASSGSVPLGKMLIRVFKGAFYVLANEYAATGIPFLRVSDISSGAVDLSKCTFLPREIHERESKTQVRAGDLLIAKTGEKRYAAVVPGWLTEANISQDLVGAAPDRDRLDSYFAVAFLKSRFGYEQMVRGLQEYAHPHISNEEVKAIEIPNTQPSIQRAIGDKLRAAERLL